MNQEKEIDIVHFNNGTGGGVWTVIQNLVQFSEDKLIRNHVIFTINKKGTPEYSIPSIPKAASIQVFYYSPDWNFYYTCKQLAKLLPDDKAVIVAHDWLELGMVSHLGLRNPVVQFLHGDYAYYYDLAKTHEKWVDKFIAVADNISQRLKSVIPKREKDIEYLRFPVASAFEPSKKLPGCNIVFVGRLTEGKGYQLLPEIAREIQGRNINTQWHIVGEDCDGLKNTVSWETSISKKFYGQIENSQLRKLLPAMNFIVLPSSAEGMPVNIIEAMKSGVIPVVNDIAGGIQELVNNGETGFRIKSNDPSAYAERIEAIVLNKELEDTLRKNCIETANNLFDEKENTLEIEKVIIKTSGVKRNKTGAKIYGSCLDKKWLPNPLVSVIRQLGK